MKQKNGDGNKILDGQREANYDLLRIICAIAVIMIHVSSIYQSAITSEDVFGQLYDKHTISILLYNTLSRFAVPCFIMLSGAFLLADDRNSDCRFFYRKCIKNVGVPTIVFSILYFVYSECLSCMKIVMEGKGISELLTPVINVLIGEPFFHMWYLYTLIGIYLIVPVILYIKKKTGEENFRIISIVVLIMASISGWTSSFVMHWSIAKSLRYVGYLLIGYQLRRCCKDRKHNGTAILLIISGIMTLLFLTYIQYEQSLKGMAIEEGQYSLIGNFSPLIVASSVLLFAGFSKLRLNCNFGKFSARTFYIYLFHAGVWNLLSQFIKIIGGSRDARLIIPISGTIVLVISYVLSVIWVKLWSKIERKYSITEKVYRLFKLG